MRLEPLSGVGNDLRTGPRRRAVRRSATLSLAVVAFVSLGADGGATSAFTPADGRYKGDYTSGHHGPGKVRLRVEPLRPGLHGVRLVNWRGQLRCPGEGTRSVSVRMTAARIGRRFSGFVTYVTPPGKDRFTGRFTARDALRATVRVTRDTGDGRCDTGPITFAAHRVGP
jgi:hypothetical protein